VRLHLSPSILRTAAAGCFAAVWMAACLEQSAVSADDLSESQARPQFDEFDLGAVAGRMASTAGSLTAAASEAGASFNAPERRNWDFWPSRYPGLRMDKAAAEQRAQADELLRLGLSRAGYRKLKLIQALEPLNPWHSPYYSALVFGSPDEERWGWRFQGHHLSFNFTLSGGRPILGTPLFLGSQPLSHPSIGGGAAPLADEEELARRLYQSLDGDQRRQATIDRPPYAYLPERSAQVRPYEPIGAAATGLNEQNRALLDQLIRSYVENLAPAIAEARLAAIEGERDSLRFAWAGSDQPSRDHYYRIQGDDLLIEYDSRDGGSHIHSVLRSMRDDFGSDPLRAHYAAMRHSPAQGW